MGFLGKDGDIVYSKNNVCVHPPKKADTADGLLHSPGYLTIHCQHDDQLGVTLILQVLAFVASDACLFFDIFAHTAHVIICISTFARAAYQPIRDLRSYF